MFMQLFFIEACPRAGCKKAKEAGTRAAADDAQAATLALSMFGAPGVPLQLDLDALRLAQWLRSRTERNNGGDDRPAGMLL